MLGAASGVEMLRMQDRNILMDFPQVFAQEKFSQSLPL